MPDLIAISQGLNAVKAMTELVKAAVGLHGSARVLENSVELNSKIADVQIALNSALAEQSALVDTIDNLEQEVARLKAWDREKQNYELKDLNNSGSFAYLVKPDAQGTEPIHCLCTRCYQDGKKRILQNTGQTPSGWERKV